MIYNIGNIVKSIQSNNILTSQIQFFVRNIEPSELKYHEWVDDL